MLQPIDTYYELVWQLLWGSQTNQLSIKKGGYLEKKYTGFVGVVQCAQMHHPEINMVPENVQRKCSKLHFIAADHGITRGGGNLTVFFF